ncbi:MAG: hypothetical protein ACSHXL_03875, partial [Bacteroidota bacterium]
MKHILLLLLPFFMASCDQNNIVKEVASPDSKNKIVFELNDVGQLFYSISSNNLEFLQLSALG